MPIVDELVTLLRFKADTGDADKMEATMGDIKDSVKKAGLALVALTAGVATFIKKSLSSVDASALFAESIGITYEQLQEMEFAIVSVGGSISDLHRDLESLTNSISNLEPGQFNAVLAQMEIDTRNLNGTFKTSIEILEEVASEFDGMGRIEQFHWGKRLGMSTGTINLLRKGKEGLAALRKEAHDMGGIVSAEELASVRKFQETWNQLIFTVQALFKAVAVGLAPALKEYLKIVKNWIKQNKDLVKIRLREFIEGAIRGIEKFTKVVKILAGPVIYLMEKLGFLTDDMDRVEAISNIVAGVLTGALVAGFVAVGGQVLTFIGILGKLAMLLKAHPLLALAAVVTAVVYEFVQLVKEAGGVSEAFGYLGEVIQEDYIDPIMKAIRLTKEFFGIKAPKKKPTGLTAEQQNHEIKKGWDAIQQRGVIESAIRGMEMGRLTGDYSGTSVYNPERGGNSNTSNNSSNSNKIELKQEFNITTANPKAAAEEVSRRTKDILQSTQPGVGAPALD